MEFYFSDRVYLRYHFLAFYEKASRYNVLRGIGVGEQLHAERVPGRFALIVETSNWKKSVQPSGVICTPNIYMLDASRVFKESARKTFEQLVDEVEVVETAPSREARARRGLAGTIIVQSDSFESHLTFSQVRAEAVAVIAISANITVEGVEGKLLGASAGSSKSVENSDGIGCGLGIGSLADATSKAIREIMERLGDRLTNAPNLKSRPIAKKLLEKTMGSERKQ